MFAILGSGFGLYGYLPALVAGGERIALPERYRTRLQSRAELAQFGSAVPWLRDEAEALNSADGVALALRPRDQVDWLLDCLARNNIVKLLIEKPIAPTPQDAASLLVNLLRANKPFRIGYTFHHTKWAQQLLATFKTRPLGPLAITWTFFAHHYRNRLHTWKQFTNEGGGAIRYYGIQVIALLAELGYREVLSSRSAGVDVDDIERWAAHFVGPGLPPCKVLVDARAGENRFTVRCSNNAEPQEMHFDADDPFYETEREKTLGLDRRVAVLGEIFRSLAKDYSQGYSLYERVIQLWLDVEKKTCFLRVDPTVS
jgi:predicted dehydrogenase